MKNKKIILLFILLTVYLLLPISVKAENVVVNGKFLWQEYYNKTASRTSTPTYFTEGNVDSKGSKKTRYTGQIMGFTYDKDNASHRVFCIEPGVSFSSGTKYKISSDAPTLANNDWNKNFKKYIDYIKEVMSCYYTHGDSKEYYSIMAAQSLVWELVSGERNTINARSIMGGTYTPSPGYLLNSNDYSLYERIFETDSNKKYKRPGLNSAYQSILKCVARYNITSPSWLEKTESKAQQSKQLLNGSYDDATQTFSRKFEIGSSTEDSNLFKYYTFKINGSTADCKNGATVSGITCKCTDKACTFSTNKEISAANAKTIEFKYSYKNDGKTPLQTTSTSFLTLNKYQTLMIGSKSYSLYLSVYTDEKPTYQLKVRKVDKNNKLITTGTAQFDVYSDAKLTKKVGSITTTKGEGTLTGLTSIGNYYVKETKAPEGYSLNPEASVVYVSKTDKGNSYATISMKDNSIVLHMDKYTINAETGKQEYLTGDSCSVNTCPDNRENGPIFTIKSGNKNVCVTKTSDGKYKFHSIADTCPSGTESQIKTCNGKFDIETIPAGTYVVTEIATVCGSQLPSETSKTVVVKPEGTTSVSMVNAYSGVIFNKVTENGNLLDGGKYSLQIKENGVFKDILLKHVSGVVYVYEENLKEEDGTYVLETTDGTINVKNLPIGEYRFVEKQAPTGYDIIKDKDSTALFTISDKSATDYQVQLVNKKTKTKGSYDSAELIVTIITGRRVINYTLVILSLAIALAALILLRNKFKK